jgi:general L-amino acid transport system permease protein
MTRSGDAFVSILRNRRLAAGLTQAAFAVAVVFAGAAMLDNMAAELGRRGLPLGFAFLGQPARFAIAETPIPYDESASYLHAFLAGAANTVLVSVLGIVIATALGTAIGLGRLSRNPLVRASAGLYIEIVRNVPLLVQLFVWYAVLFLNLPPQRASLALPGGVFLNNRGVYVPALHAAADWHGWAWAMLITGLLGLMALWRVNRRRRADGRPPLSAWLGAAWLALPLAALTAVWQLLTGAPFVADYPSLQGFNFQGGARVTPEFAALLLGLGVYTAAFIAEVVRAGVQAVPRGQSEAAAALGLSRPQAVRFIILPQALRVIIPPLVNQYLNLTKNSSLAVAIAFPDLVAVGSTIINQSGNAVQMMVLIMGSYLVLSLLISAGLNVFNRRALAGGP